MFFCSDSPDVEYVTWLAWANPSALLLSTATSHLLLFDPFGGGRLDRSVTPSFSVEGHLLMGIPAQKTRDEMNDECPIGKITPKVGDLSSRLIQKSFEDHICSFGITNEGFFALCRLGICFIGVLSWSDRVRMLEVRRLWCIWVGWVGDGRKLLGLQGSNEIRKERKKERKKENKKKNK
jgi:hypothetical protein